jgi:hypothetical protein
VGGLGEGDFLDATAELFDEETGTWTQTGSMGTPRHDMTATLLPSGKVLVVGGSGPLVLDTAELYDPDTGTWDATGSLATGRADHAATLLRSGAVLAAGGGELTSAELYHGTDGLCARDATPSVEVLRFTLDSVLFLLFRLEFVVVHNKTASPIPGPLAFVMDDLHGALFVGSRSNTRCFSPADGDPYLFLFAGNDNVLSPNEYALAALWFFRPLAGPFTYVPVVLSGIPAL